jgi:hypothetical protein
LVNSIGQLRPSAAPPKGSPNYCFARCDKVLAAVDRSAGVEFGSLRTSDAFDAALALVASFDALYCVKALAAADFSAAEDDGFERTLEAFDATDLLVCLAITTAWC